MFQQDIQAVLDAVLEIDGATLRDDYSGRFMYGKTCKAIVLEHPTQSFAYKFFADWIEVLRKNASTEAEFNLHLDVLLELQNDVKVDQMGKGQVLYFPSLT